MLAHSEQQRAVEADPTAGLTAEVICQAFLQCSEAHNQPRTHTGYAEILPKFYNATLGDGSTIGAVPARKIDAGHLDAVLARMKAAGNSQHYAARLARSVKRVWSWASSLDRNRSPERLVPTNTLAEVRGPKIPRSPERYLAREPVEAFLRWVYRSARADRLGWDASRRRSKEALPTLRHRFDRLFVMMIRFVRISGCRPDEAARATWDGLDLARRTLTIRGKTTHATGAMRVVFLTPSLARMLRVIELMPSRHPRFVFTHKLGRFADARGETDRLAGEPYRDKALQHKVASLRAEAKEAGLAIEDKGPNRLVLYAMRHTRLSDDLMAGGNVAENAAIHGTSPRMIEQVYGHLLNGHLSRLNDYLVIESRSKK